MKDTIVSALLIASILYGGGHEQLRKSHGK